MRLQITFFTKSLLLGLITYSASAQQINTQNTTNVMINDIRTHMARFDENAEEKIKGSPFINEDFELVKISQMNDSIYKARYNAFTHEMQIKSNDDKILALDADVDYEVKFITRNKIYKSFSYVNDFNNTVNRFLVVLKENEKCSLYKEEHIEYKDKVEGTSGYSKEKPASYNRIDDVYFVKINDELKTIPTKKKQFLKFFSNHETKLKTYLKQNKLNPKNEIDLIEIIEYLSTII